ncbi:MAG: hypothetical protein IPM42_18965 [Saprospiraceae bacterium]|nr:hypothetical protein [Saprospiraceae bacterium]
MANQMLKPYSFLLYLLALLTFFFIGMSYAGIVGAGKNQGLAGGAIVVVYGLISAVIGLIIALFISYKSDRNLIFRINIILSVFSVGFYVYYHIKNTERQKVKDPENQKTEAPKQQTTPVGEPVGLVSYHDIQIHDNTTFGLGMFLPTLSDLKTLYFYNNPNFDKTIMDQLPADSITFKRTENGEFDIATAPPYLVPEHLKLDYGILYFKAISITDEFIEIEVNKLNHQTAFVSKSNGDLKYWPEFLLIIHSVEFLNPATQNIYVKPLDHAGLVKQSYSFMQPLKINQNWMYVSLINDDYETVGKGWIKWNDNGNLMITYSLLS